MKYVYVLLTAVVLMSGCVASRLNKYVSRRYGNQLPRHLKIRNDVLSIKSAVPYNATPLSTTTKKAKVLPLLFYWHVDNRITCTLNPGIFVNKFSNDVQRLARRKIIKELDGRQLELTIKKVPHVFSFDDDAHIVWIVFYYFGWEKVGLYPSNEDLVVSYKLIDDDDNVTKSGIINLPNNSDVIGIRYFESLKRATNEYLAKYDLGIRNMAKNFLTQLEGQLALQ